MDNIFDSRHNKGGWICRPQTISLLKLVRQRRKTNVIRKNKCYFEKPKQNLTKTKIISLLLRFGDHSFGKIIFKTLFIAQTSYQINNKSAQFLLKLIIRKKLHRQWLTPTNMQILWLTPTKMQILCLTPKTSNIV